MEDKMNMEGFGKVFWGALLILLTVQANGFDLFPDFIGYILILLGLKNAKQGTMHYVRAYNLAMVLIFTGLVRFYMAPVEVGDGVLLNINALGVLTGSPIISSLFNVCHSLIEICLFYALCMGTKELYEKCGDLQWAVLCSKIWHVVLIGCLGNVVSVLAAYWMNQITLILVSMLAFVWIIGMISLLVMLWKARKKLTNHLFLQGPV